MVQGPFCISIKRPDNSWLNKIVTLGVEIGSKSYVPSDAEFPVLVWHRTEPRWLFPQHAAHIPAMERFPLGSIKEKKLVL